MRYLICSGTLTAPLTASFLTGPPTTFDRILHQCGMKIGTGVSCAAALWMMCGEQLAHAQATPRLRDLEQCDAGTMAATTPEFLGHGETDHPFRRSVCFRSIPARHTLLLGAALERLPDDGDFLFPSELILIGPSGVLATSVWLLGQHATSGDPVPLMIPGGIAAIFGLVSYLNAAGRPSFNRAQAQARLHAADARGMTFGEFSLLQGELAHAASLWRLRRFVVGFTTLVGALALAATIPVLAGREVPDHAYAQPLVGLALATIGIVAAFFPTPFENVAEQLLHDQSEVADNELPRDTEGNHIAPTPSETDDVSVHGSVSVLPNEALVSVIGAF